MPYIISGGPYYNVRALLPNFEFWSLWEEPLGIAMRLVRNKLVNEVKGLGFREMAKMMPHR